MNKTKSGKGFIIAGVIIIAFFVLGLINNISRGRTDNLTVQIICVAFFCILGAVFIFIGYLRAKKAKNNANVQNMYNMQNTPNMQNFQNMNNQSAQTNANANGFCSKCGNPLSGDPFCSKCGSPVNH